MVSKNYYGGRYVASVNGGSLLGGSNRCPYVFSSLGQAQNACNNNSACQYIQKQNGLCGGKTYELRGSGRMSIDNLGDLGVISDYGRKYNIKYKDMDNPRDSKGIH